MNPIKIIKPCFIILVLVALLSGCKDDLTDSPPLNEPDGIITIAELRALYKGQPISFHDNIAVFATVTMDESSGNIYRNIFVQDETAGINVRMDFAGNVRNDERVRLALKGSVLGSYNSMLQLDSVVFGKNLIQQGDSEKIAPVSVTIPDILDGMHQARLVRLEDVQFASNEIGRRFANVIDGLSENRTLIDCQNNRIIVRTSPFADFANLTVPAGNGSLVAVVSQFGTTWQLLLRSMDEVDMTGERCDTGEPSGSGTFGDPFNVAYAIKNNSGNNVWVEGYIVGVMEPSGNTNRPRFEPPFSVQTNIILADRPDDTEDSHILPVQLPPGQVRNALNLVSNPANRGKMVKVKGNLEAYFVPRPGMRGTSGYWLDGQGIGDGGVWDNLTPMTIGEVRDLYKGSTLNIPENRMITGIVISDRENANITSRNLQIIDADDGTGIVMRFNAAHTFEVGSLIRINISQAELSLFNGLMQLTNIPNNNADLIEITRVPDPEETTIAKILGNIGYYESRLVKIKNVTMTGGTTWRGTNGSLTLNDGTGSIIHFTTSYAAFANAAIPREPVNLTAIVTVFNVPQLSVRSPGDAEIP